MKQALRTLINSWETKNILGESRMIIIEDHPDIIGEYRIMLDIIVGDDVLPSNPSITKYVPLWIRHTFFTLNQSSVEDQDSNASCPDLQIFTVLAQDLENQMIIDFANMQKTAYERPNN